MSEEQKQFLASRAILLYSAGLGRAPATALTYMYWFRGFTLDSAFEKLRAVRPCNPNLQAVRQATCDTLLDQGKTYPVKIAVSRPGSATDIQVSNCNGEGYFEKKAVFDHAQLETNAEDV